MIEKIKIISTKNEQLNEEINKYKDNKDNNDIIEFNKEINGLYELKNGQNIEIERLEKELNIIKKELVEKNNIYIVLKIINRNLKNNTKKTKIMNIKKKYIH